MVSDKTCEVCSIIAGLEDGPHHLLMEISSVALPSSSILIYYFLFILWIPCFLASGASETLQCQTGVAVNILWDSQNLQQRVHKWHNDVEGRTERRLMFSCMLGTSGGHFRNVQRNVAYKKKWNLVATRNNQQCSGWLNSVGHYSCALSKKNNNKKNKTKSQTRC